MATAIHRTTKEIRRSVHTPDFSPVIWVVYGKGSQSKLASFDALLATVPARHIKFDGSDNPSEMTAGEKTTEDVKTQSLELVSDAAPDLDGVPAVAADGVAIHTLTVRKRDLSGNLVASGTQTIRLLSDAPVLRDRAQVILSSGSGGLATTSALNIRGDVILSAVDVAGVLRPGTLKIRFK